MKIQRNQRRGVAMILALLAIIAILGALGMVMTQVIGARTETDHACAEILLEEACRAGIDMAVKPLWDDYVETAGNTTRNWASYRYYLDNTLNIPINEDLNFNGTQDNDETGNGDGDFDTLPSGTDPRGWALPGLPKELKDPETGRLIATIAGVYIARYDTWDLAHLTVTSVANVGGKIKTAVQALSIGGKSLPHTQFCVLSNNISCLLCHAEIRSLKLERNADPALYNSFDRIKIASLQSMLVRKDEAYSNLAGTIYTRGKVYKQDNTQYTAAELQASLFKGYKFDSTNGKITQSATGAMTSTSLVNATKNAKGDLNQFANLYMDYPLDETKQTDGPLPNSFPAPFPDENSNRTVDDSEFQVIVNSANGAIDFDLASDKPPSAGGSVNAGIAYGVPAGSVYTPPASGGLPEASNSALSELATNGTYNGNLILVGTDTDPIQINRSVAINGDLVIKGPVKGYGQLLVRGNTYITGDVTYKDAPGEFGVAADGTENAFALVSGGSIMMGDYLTIRGVNHTALNSDKFPDWSQYSIHARESTKSNSVTKKVSGVNKTETLKWGYFDTYSVDAGATVTGRQGQQYSFTTSELMLFNKMEVDKWIADTTYKPRLYGLRESQPNNLYVYNATDEHAVQYSDTGVKTLSTYLTSKGKSLTTFMANAVVQYCSPKANWMSEDTLRKIWFADELTRPSSGRPWKFDGLLYSNNSIWNIVRSQTRHNSYTKGKMEVRGGIIASDLGVFVPEGFTLQYDPRVERFLQFTDTSVVQFTRRAFYFDKEPASPA